MKRETEKIIDYKGKSIRLKKFTPLDGGYITQMILSSLMPEVLETALKLNRPFQPSRKMSKDEYIEFMTDCLNYVTYLQESPVKAEIPVLNDNGSLRIDDFGFEDTFMLMIEILGYNMLGFFSQENIQSLVGMMMNFTKALKSSQSQMEQQEAAEQPKDSERKSWLSMK